MVTISKYNLKVYPSNSKIGSKLGRGTKNDQNVFWSEYPFYSFLHLFFHFVAAISLQNALQKVPLGNSEEDKNLGLYISNQITKLYIPPAPGRGVVPTTGHPAPPAPPPPASPPSPEVKESRGLG